MKIFIVGLPQSGRTTVAKSVCQEKGFNYVDAFSWIRSNFRDPKPGEHLRQFEDEFHYWLIGRMKNNPRMFVDMVHSTMDSYPDKDANFIIDGLVSPRDFAELFDYNNDFVVFLNRTNGQDVEVQDYQNIGVSVMRDYCFWLSSAGLLPKSRWFEYNFKLSDEDSDSFKALGSKNSVFMIRSFKRVISHLKETLQELILPSHQS
jgi:adenylate kinase family enzyme